MEERKALTRLPGRDETAIKPGDVIAFGGEGLIGALISLGTYGVPFRSAAHVGIVAEIDGRLRLVESVIDSNDVCLVRGVAEHGVKVVGLNKRIERYVGRVWHYPLSRRLYDFESERLTAFLLSQLGKPYDAKGAVKSGGILLSAFKAKHGDDSDMSRFFCSKLVIAGHSDIGIFQTPNAAKWSPNHLLRAEYRAGVLKHPRRLK